MLNLAVPPTELPDANTCKALKHFLNNTFKKTVKTLLIKKIYKEGFNVNNV